MLYDTSNVPPENKGKDKIFMTEMPPLITARTKTPWAKVLQITVFSIFGVVILFYVLGLSLTLKSEQDRNVVLHVHDTVQFHVYEDNNNSNDYKAEKLPRRGFFDFFFPENSKTPGNVEIQIIEIEEGNGDDEIPTELTNLVSLENDKKLGDSEKMVSASEKASPEVSTESSSVKVSSASGSDSSSSGSSSKDSSGSSDVSSPESSNLKTNHRTFPRIINFEDIDQSLNGKLLFRPNFPFEDFKTVDEIFKSDPFFNK